MTKAEVRILENQKSIMNTLSLILNNYPYLDDIANHATAILKYNFNATCDMLEESNHD